MENGIVDKDDSERHKHNMFQHVWITLYTGEGNSKYIQHRISHISDILYDECIFLFVYIMNTISIVYGGPLVDWLARWPYSEKV